ncbi:MAG TPA: hypothetical protein VGL89_02100 [Candidatus Koribacter sp.]|jgi:hypothetical protein
MSSRLCKLLPAAFLCMPLVSYAQAPLGQLYSTVAKVRGSVNLANGGTTVLSGSSIEAGQEPASLVLGRGGSVTVCQGTTVSINSSANGHDLMFSFGSGAIESRYAIGTSADVILTPDFRFAMTGPGEFDLNIEISPQGDTCVRSLGASTGGVIVTENIGDGTYQIKPSDFVLFRKGRVADVAINPHGIWCGCPAPKETRRDVQVAEAPKPVAVPVRETPASPPVSKASSRPTATPAPVQAPAQAQVPINPILPSAVPESLKQPLAERIVEENKHMVADAPFVFSYDGSAPAYTNQVMRLRFELSDKFILSPAVQLPAPKPSKKGFWQKVAGLFR